MFLNSIHDKMKILEFLDQYTFLFSLAYTMITVVIGFLATKLIPVFKRYKIRKCLSLGKRECKIILPNYKGKLYNQVDILAMCPIGDIKAAFNVIELIHSTGLYSHKESIIYEENDSVHFGHYNIFCIGGSLANHYTYELFQQFFGKFKICAPQEKCDLNPNKIPKTHFKVCEDEGFCWGENENEKFIVKKEERYAIIVKLSSEDFGIGNHGTVHIIFGNGIEGTVAISKYLLNNYQDLYKKVKSKNHYFLAFKIIQDTGLIMPNSFTDLTEVMFQQ